MRSLDPVELTFTLWGAFACVTLVAGITFWVWCVRRHAHDEVRWERLMREHAINRASIRTNEIDNGLRKMRIASKCPKTGHLVLETITPEDQALETADYRQSLGCCWWWNYNSKKKKERSSETLEPDHDAGECADYDDDDDDDEDEENVCAICFSRFEVDDVVMWSRHKVEKSCHHVFHEKCLMQWLLERGENKCPTCRAPFIQGFLGEKAEEEEPEEPTERTTTERTIDAEGTAGDLSGDREENDTRAEDDHDDDDSIEVADSDIEEGGSSAANGARVSFAGNSSNLDNDSDSNEGEDDESDSDIENNAAPVKEIEEDDEEGYTYIIAKGLVRKAPEP